MGLRAVLPKPAGHMKAAAATGSATAPELKERLPCAEQRPPIARNARPQASSGSRAAASPRRSRWKCTGT